MKSKETLFSKGNHDIQLEEIIEKKDFSDEAKSLILNIMYKIDNAYKDYSKIKFEAKNREEIISEITNIVKNDCNKIEIASPKDIQKKFIVNKTKKEIKVFPSEINLLQALYYINTTESKTIKNILNRAVTSVINVGISVDGAEIIRDFNGWSWTGAIENNISKYQNIIFQDLALLIGRRYLEKIIKSDNIRFNLIEKLQELYGDKKTNEIIKNIDTCCLLIYMSKSKNKTDKISIYLNKQLEKLKLYENKIGYISRITAKNNELVKEIGKIEKILKNKDVLEKKYLRPKIKDKFKMIDNYRNYLMKKQRLKLEKIEKNSNLINPFEYAKRKKQLSDEIETIKNVQKILQKKNSIYSNIINLQRSVISCFYKKIEVYDLRKELLNLVYEIRYFSYIPIKDDLKVMNINELEVDIRNIERKLISKLLDEKTIENFSKDDNINYFILKYIFVTKTANMNKLYVKLNYKNKKLFLEYYDENELEYKNEKNFNNDEFNELSKKMKKRIKIFI